MIKEKLYFPNLNGIRSIAALLVIIHHTELFKSFYTIDGYFGKSAFIDVIGHLGVVLFFVLSGFLITYLLLMEEKTTNRISVKKFYIRRILRIWPLYMLIIILALFVLPQLSFFTVPGFSKDFVLDNLPLKVALYFTFFANLVLSIFGLIPYASQTWSIGTEEQFYLVWPVIMKFVKKKRLLLMVSIIVLYSFVPIIINSRYFGFYEYKGVITSFWNGFTIDCMAIGGFYAVLSFQGNKLLKILQNQYFFYFVLITTITLIIFGYSFPKFHDESYAVLFGIIIMNFAVNKQIVISLENKLLNYLGKISYGLYMFHPIAIVIALKICLYTNLLSNYFIYPLSILLSILLSGLSYRFFEKKFLSYKVKFSSIISGDNSRTEIEKQ